MILVLLGILTGCLVASTGVGGGTLLTPLLVLVSVPLTVVVGTDLAAASGTKLVAALRHGRARQVDWRVAGGLALGSLPAAFLTGRLHLKIEVLAHLLAAVVLLAGTLQLALPLGGRPARVLGALPLPPSPA